MSKNDVSKAIATNFIVFVEALPNLEFFITDSPIPDIDVGFAPVTTRVHDFGLHGDKVEFGQLTIGFMVDEYFYNYEELYKWLFMQANPVNVEASDIPKTDIYVKILDNNKNPAAELKFVDAFPTNMGGLTFNSQGTPDPLQGTVTFKYSYFLFKRLGTSPAPAKRKPLHEFGT
jgi:hypothetical protein